MDITNKTSRPLAVPLPGGKKLRLGPRKTGQITPKAAEFPAVQQLIEAGDLELDTSGKGGGSGLGGAGGGGGVGPSQRIPGGGIRHTGDG